MMSSCGRYSTAVAAHYARIWRKAPHELNWNQGPVHQLPKDFRVLEFPPDEEREMWTYATCGMSAEGCDEAIELHLFSPVRATELVELLTATAHFHMFGAHLALGHTVNFGRPWLDGSPCTFGLISLPYLDGMDLEVMHWDGGDVRFLWLVPVTPAEVEFKKRYGLNALEQLFEEQAFNYVNPMRADVTVHR